MLTYNAVVEKQQDEQWLDRGYDYTVFVLDSTFDNPLLDVIDIVDFKNEFAAQTYADAVNLTQRPYLYA